MSEPELPSPPEGTPPEPAAGEPEKPAAPPLPISVILPILSAVEQPEEIIRKWAAHLDSLSREYEILVVNYSGAQLEALASQPRIRVLPHPDPISPMPERRSLGAALRSGFAAAGWPLVCYADLDYDPADLDRLLERIDKVDLVTGHRPGRPVPILLKMCGLLFRGFVRILVGDFPNPLPSWLGWKAQLYHWLLCLVSGVRVHDVSSGLKLFRRDIMSRIPIQSDGAFVHGEILAKANFLGCLMDEVPIFSGPLKPEALGPLLREAYRILSRADFGPVEVPGWPPAREPPSPERVG